jgi:hypothetical protein
MRTSIIPLAVLVLTACGTKQEEPIPAAAAPEPEAPEAGVEPPPAPKRTLLRRPLLPTLPQNLLLDGSFRGEGWGQFLNFFDGQQRDGASAISLRTFSRSPVGITTPVVAVRDPSGTDERTRAITAIASFLGGPGPFRARIWVSRTDAAGDPRDFEDDPTVFRAAITTEGYPEGRAYDLARVDSATFGDRTWILFEAIVEAELPSGFFNLRFGRKGGGYLLQAPEVVPTALLQPTAAALRAGTFVALERALAVDELSAIAAYKRQPLQLGVPVAREPAAL